MGKQKVFLTGASGNMGYVGLKALLEDRDQVDIVILVRPSKKNKTLFASYEQREGLRIHWGDLTHYDDVYTCIEGVDIILHVGAFVSPAADYHPKQAMSINYGSACNIVKAIKAQDRMNDIKLVNIGTIAETGDRMPPIHWGRIGDPIKPSVYDSYADYVDRVSPKNIQGDYVDASYLESISHAVGLSFVGGNAGKYYKFATSEAIFTDFIFDTLDEQTIFIPAYEQGFCHFVRADGGN